MKSFFYLCIIMELIDTHCHLYDPAYAADLSEVIDRAVAAGVSAMIQADIDSSERDAMLSVCSRFPDVLPSMRGLYPGSVKEDWRQEVDKVVGSISADTVAIGEIGLDYHWDTTWKQEQKEALRCLLEIASEKDLPVNIHCRDATEDFIAIIKDCRHLHLRGNMHAYSGSLETFRQISLYGDWSVGIGGVVTFRNSAIGKAVRNIPLDRIVLETDAPYLSPVPHRGERNESKYLTLIAGFIAEAKGIGIEEVAARTSENAKRLFGI